MSLPRGVKLADTKNGKKEIWKLGHACAAFNCSNLQCVMESFVVVVFFTDL